MDGDPYARLVAVMRGQGADESPAGDSEKAGLGAAAARMRLGTVVSTGPLMVRVMGIVQPPSALCINERLVAGAKWKTKNISPDSDYTGLTGPISGPVDTPMGLGSLIRLTDGTVHSTKTIIDKTLVEQLELDLEIGDTVLMLTEDDQKFYIVMKVVGA